MATIVYNTATQAVLANGTFQLTTTGLQKGCNTSATLNGISIKKPGLYNITGIVTGGTTGDIGVYVNGVRVPYATGSINSSSATLHFPLQVNSNCQAITSNLPATITLVNIGTTTITASNASLYAEKIA